MKIYGSSKYKKEGENKKKFMKHKKNTKYKRILVVFT